MPVLPDSRRLGTQLLERAVPVASQTALWQHWVSATSASAHLGIGESAFYREQMITAFFGQVIGATLGETQTPAGVAQMGKLAITSDYVLSSADRIVWRGNSYRVDSEPRVNRINATYTYGLKAGE